MMGGYPLVHTSWALRVARAASLRGLGNAPAGRAAAGGRGALMHMVCILCLNPNPAQSPKYDVLVPF
jgi:hypothetical protein